MEKIVLKAYEIGNNKVNVLSWRDLYAKYKNTLFKPLNYKSEWGFYKGKWQEVKEALLGKRSGVKHEDDIYYLSTSLGDSQFLIFAIGTGRKDTLQKIYLRSLEEQKEKNNNVEEAKPSSNKQEEVIDVSDKSIDENKRFEAIINKKPVKGQLDEEDTYKFIRYCITDSEINKLKSDEKYLEKFIMVFANTLKKYKDEFDKYNCNDLKSKEIASLLKDINKESKKSSNYYNELMNS